MATFTYNYQQIAAAWIVKNNPSAVRNALVNNGLIANISVAGLMTEKQLVDILYNYYLTNGRQAYASLLRQIPVNENISSQEVTQAQEAAASLDVTPTVASSVSGLPTTLSFGSVLNDIWIKLVGKTETVTTPVVVVEEKASPVTIGLIIGGIAILGIIAWVVMKS